MVSRLATIEADLDFLVHPEDPLRFELSLNAREISLLLLMSSLKLSPSEAREAFDQLVSGLARQHTRTKFRNYFAKGEIVLDAKIFARGTVLPERNKPVANMLQEQPDSIRATLFTGADAAFSAVSRTEPSSITLQELLCEEQIEQALIIRGRRAELFAYYDPTADMLYLHRVAVVDAEEKPKPATAPKKVSRKYRASPKRPSTNRR